MGLCWSSATATSFSSPFHLFCSFAAYPMRFHDRIYPPSFLRRCPCMWVVLFCLFCANKCMSTMRLGGRWVAGNDLLYFDATPERSLVRIFFPLFFFSLRLLGFRFVVFLAVFSSSLTHLLCTTHEFSCFFLDYDNYTFPPIL